jgi:hypothetical protein
MVMHPMESKDIAANHVRSKAVKIQHQMGIQRSAAKKLYDHIKSEVAYEDSQEHLE